MPNNFFAKQAKKMTIRKVKLVNEIAALPEGKAKYEKQKELKYVRNELANYLGAA